MSLTPGAVYPLLSIHGPLIRLLRVNRPGDVDVELVSDPGTAYRVRLINRGWARAIIERRES